MSGKGFLGNMTENLQADCVQSRQAGFVRRCLNIMKGQGLYMDLNMVKYLAELSKLEYSDKELAATAEQMTDIIDLMDTVKEIDITYDDLKDNHDVYLNDLRKDEVIESMPTSKVLSNAVNTNNCFVVPKVVE